MTFAELLSWLSDHPLCVGIYVLVWPALAYIIGDVDRSRGHRQPWNYIYAGILYLVCIPGLFALTLVLYGMIFDGRSLMQVDIVTEILPIVSMILTLSVIGRRADLDVIPGFDKITGFLLVIFGLMILFWFLDKMRIVAFTHFPFHYLLLLFGGLVLAIAIGLGRLRRG